MQCVMQSDRLVSTHRAERCAFHSRPLFSTRTVLYLALCLRLFSLTGAAEDGDDAKSATIYEKDALV